MSASRASAARNGRTKARSKPTIVSAKASKRPNTKKARGSSAAKTEAAPAKRKNKPAPITKAIKATKATKAHVAGPAGKPTKSAEKQPAQPRTAAIKGASAVRAKKKVAVQAAPEPIAPVRAAPAPQEGSMEQSAKRAIVTPGTKKAGVVRIAGGLRTPKGKAARPNGLGDGAEAPAKRSEARPDLIRRVPSPRVEVNPRLQSSKDIAKNPPRADGEKPMSVAEKHRAAAEAMFARLTVNQESSSAPANGSAGAPLPYAARKQDEGGGSYTMRVSEFDSLTTALRLASSREEALRAAAELAERFKLPMDQALLLKVISLGDHALSKLALEELLELEDRGRVRPTPELKSVLSQLESRDPEVLELRALLLEKIGD
ncbi:MAG: hypothetical protein IT384_26665 [Deltaproteobacteria bacterium]|nr:hypothetical protein [Deltaproteobacteria bacterium]